MAAAAAAEVQTELAARVAVWRSKIGPALEDQDARGDFDIHTYAAVSLSDIQIWPGCLLLLPALLLLLMMWSTVSEIFWMTRTSSAYMVLAFAHCLALVFTDVLLCLPALSAC